MGLISSGAQLGSTVRLRLSSQNGALLQTCSRGASTCLRGLESTFMTIDRVLRHHAVAGSVVLGLSLLIRRRVDNVSPILKTGPTTLLSLKRRCPSEQHDRAPPRFKDPFQPAWLERHFSAPHPLQRHARSSDRRTETTD